jgi:FKBP-type peptidyl-prolyl cis-trans isomerase FkpA
MKKILFLLTMVVVAAFSHTGCNDNSIYEKQLEDYQKQVLEQFGKDTVIINNYLTEHQITAIKDTTGIYYRIDVPGEELHPTDYSYIEVKYKGYLTNGTVFDETETDKTYFAYLYNLVSGWRIGIPKIGKGGKITLFLPSYYGYGSNANGEIPANSVLIFEIELIGFQ